MPATMEAGGAQSGNELEATPPRGKEAAWRLPRRIQRR